MVITIDGLGVNGKSTLAKIISEKINFKNFNTGAIYRCIALTVIENNIDVNNINLVIEKIKKLDINFEKGNVILNGEDVTSKIRTEEISVKSTKWATILEIKDVVRNIQKEFIKKYDTIMEGRDIGTRIAPNAELKFYLYSDFDIRVERLWKQDINVDKKEIRNNLLKRDELDINGGNFIKPENAIEIDTTNKSIEDVYKIMMRKILENGIIK